MTVFEGMIHMIVRIVRATIVANPLVAGSMHVRRFGMAGPIGKAGMFGSRGSVALGSVLLNTRRSGTVRGYVSAADATNRTSTSTAMFLRETRQRQEHC
jgi:hypothetical protein